MNIKINILSTDTQIVVLKFLTLILTHVMVLKCYDSYKICVHNNTLYS